METRLESLIRRLRAVIDGKIDERHYIAARLYQRDLILLMVKSKTFSGRQIADAYFELADLCARVADYKGVNKYTARAVKYRDTTKMKSRDARFVSSTNLHQIPVAFGK